ncbi:MAG: hypothetical protein Q9166_005228 [cf. Caloplaca sp. 2 TL-2023]
MLLTAALVYQSNAAPATPSKNGDVILPQAANLSQVDSPAYNAHFSMRVRPREDYPVDSLSLFMNAVDALAIIALMDYRTRSPEMQFHSPSYPSVIINVNPKPPATDTVNEVATLCIYYGMTDLVKHRQNTEATFDCLWDNVDVAEVVIRSSDPAATPVSDTTTTNLTDSLQDRFQPRFFYIPSAKDLPAAVVFITIMNAIMGFSRYTKTNIIPRCYTDPGPEWDASIVFPDDGPQPPRTPPPYLEYRHGIVALNQAPRYMVQHHRFAELTMIFRVDNMYVGHAMLLKGKPGQAVAPKLGAGVATS